MKQENIDKLLVLVDDSAEVYSDVKADLEDGKITWLEAGGLVIKHGAKVVRNVVAMKEVGQELADLDPEEADQLITEIAEKYGAGKPEAVEAAKHVLRGMTELRIGVEALVELRKN
jgi:hypothetical protein